MRITRGHLEGRNSEMLGSEKPNMGLNIRITCEMVIPKMIDERVHMKSKELSENVIMSFKKFKKFLEVQLKIQQK